MPRRPFTNANALAHGITPSALRWGLMAGRWQSVGYGVLLQGGDPPTRLEEALGVLVAVDGVASHSLAGVLHDLDGIELSEPFVTVPRAARSNRPGLKRQNLSEPDIVRLNDYRCTVGLRTMLNLAAVTDDLMWEQALECALRKELTTIREIENALPMMSQARTSGVGRIRRVLALRPLGIPPTESLLETLMVQLIRGHRQLPTPARQVEVFNRYDAFVGRVDLAWPDRRVFIELDGQHHKNQPVYDARRETAVVAAAGWLPGRFTWHEVKHVPKPTARRLVELLEAADLLRCRPE